jgi:hypothetical protein
VTTATDTLQLSFEGIPGDRHFGWTRRASGREPWYRAAPEMRNERQISLLSPDELAIIAARLGRVGGEGRVDRRQPRLEGIPHFSMLPAGTRLFFDGGAVVVVDGQNAPCRYAGRAIAQHVPDRPDIELAFAKVARRQRGLVGWVERPGSVSPGAGVSARVPEQWIYPPS